VSAPEAAHPTAILDPKARLGACVRVGAYSIVGPEVVLEDGVEIGHHVVLEGPVVVGKGAKVGHGSIVGALPQDLKFKDGTPSGVLIGAGATLREYVTVHRATHAGAFTTIGPGCLLMSMCHVAHDCRLGEGVIVINYAGITGHCEIDEYATVGGLTGVHPFSRIGAYAYVGGCSKIIADVPPYTTVDGAPATARGINVIGLRRRGIGGEDRQLLRAAFRILYRAGLSPRGAVARIREELPASPHIARLLEFIETSKRGICGPPRTLAGALDDAPDDEGERVF
jgi:UDP-N-acetylglucosamine acyltransferase